MARRDLPGSVPALHGRASLKRPRRRPRPYLRRRVPALHGRASLKPWSSLVPPPPTGPCSRPSRAGLIEAGSAGRACRRHTRRVPALHGRASLKHRQTALRYFAPPLGVPALHGRASLKRRARRARPRARRSVPALHGRASLKPPRRPAGAERPGDGVPALHGRASLKPPRRRGGAERNAKLCSRPSRAGLIEARSSPAPPGAPSRVFPPFTGGPH